MALDLTGIQNVGEFYSHHYLDALLEKDLKGLFTKWRLSDDNEDDDPTTDTPNNRLERRATDYFKAKSQALNQDGLAHRYKPSHALHVALLESLGYDYDFDVQYLLDGSAVPVLSHYVEGPDDPGFAVLRLAIESIRWWDGPGKGYEEVTLT